MGLVFNKQAVGVGGQRLDHGLFHHMGFGHGFIGALPAAQDGGGIGMGGKIGVGRF